MKNGKLNQFVETFRLFLVGCLSTVLFCGATASTHTHLSSSHYDPESGLLNSGPVQIQIFNSSSPYLTKDYGRFLRIQMDPISYTNTRGQPISVYFSKRYVSDYIVAIEAFLNMDLAEVEKSEGSTHIQTLPCLDTVHGERDLVFQLVTFTDNIPYLAVGVSRNHKVKNGTLFFNTIEAQGLISELLKLNE